MTNEEILEKWRTWCRSEESRGTSLDDAYLKLISLARDAALKEVVNEIHELNGDMADNPTDRIINSVRYGEGYGQALIDLQERIRALRGKKEKPE